MITADVLIKANGNQIQLHPDKKIPRDKQSLELACQGFTWAKVSLVENNGVSIDLCAEPAAPTNVAPIDMILPCPHCGQKHVDAPEPEKVWTNPPHRSHLCRYCGYLWRPADVPTNGVAEIKTHGEKDMDYPTFEHCSFCGWVMASLEPNTPKRDMHDTCAVLSELILYSPGQIERLELPGLQVLIDRAIRCRAIKEAVQHG